MKKIILVTLVLFTQSAFAQIPTDYFTGFMNNNSFQEYCALNNGVVQFQDTGNGSYALTWQENGFANHDGSYPCQNTYDAILTPSGKANEWDVNFNYNNDLVFGKAILNGNTLTINAQYSGMRRPFIDIDARFTFDANRKSMLYIRRIDAYGPTLIANGSLYK